jgi:uncharacterized membrane protein
VALKNGWFDIEKGQARRLRTAMVGHVSTTSIATYLFDDEVLNIEKPEFLLYLDSPRGKLLVGYMFLHAQARGPRPDAVRPASARGIFIPGPAAATARSTQILAVSRPDDQGHCAAGVRVDRSAEMLHVYLIEHPLGTFADAMVFSNGNARFSIAWVHPILVHFTIALLLLAVVLDVIGWLARREFLHRVAFVNLAVVAVITLGTMAAGMAAEMNVQMTESDHATLHTHKYFAFSVVAVVIVLALWRSALGGRFPRRAAPLYLVLALSAGRSDRNHRLLGRRTGLPSRCIGRRHRQVRVRELHAPG